MVDLPVEAGVGAGGHLHAVAVAEGSSLTGGVRRRVLDHPIVDLGPLQTLAFDPPAFEDREPAADQAHPDPGGAHHRDVQVDRLPLSGTS